MEDVYPVFLIVYDAQREVAYWLYVQAHLAGRTGRRGSGPKVMIRLPVANVVNGDAIRYFAQAKAAIREQVKGVKHHE